MVLIIEKTQNVILEIGEQLDYMENGYPRLVEKNIAFPDWSVNVYENVEVPKEVQSHKYCYTVEEGFCVNPEWEEPSNPYGIPDETYNAIIDEYTLSLVESGVL